MESGGRPSRAQMAGELAARWTYRLARGSEGAIAGAARAATVLAAEGARDPAFEAEVVAAVHRRQVLEPEDALAAATWARGTGDEPFYEAVVSRTEGGTRKLVELMRLGRTLAEAAPGGDDAVGTVLDPALALVEGEDGDVAPAAALALLGQAVREAVGRAPALAAILGRITGTEAAAKVPEPPAPQGRGRSDVMGEATSALLERTAGAAP